MNAAVSKNTVSILDKRLFVCDGFFRIKIGGITQTTQNKIGLIL
jgi:hypothetical protein